MHPSMIHNPFHGTPAPVTQPTMLYGAYGGNNQSGGNVHISVGHNGPDQMQQQLPTATVKMCVTCNANKPVTEFPVGHPLLHNICGLCAFNISAYLQQPQNQNKKVFPNTTFTNTTGSGQQTAPTNIQQAASPSTSAPASTAGQQPPAPPRQTCFAWGSPSGCTRGHACAFLHPAGQGRLNSRLCNPDGTLIECAHGKTCSEALCPFAHYTTKEQQEADPKFTMHRTTLRNDDLNERARCNQETIRAMRQSQQQPRAPSSPQAAAAPPPPSAAAAPFAAAAAAAAAATKFTSKGSAAAGAASTSTPPSTSTPTASTRPPRGHSNNKCRDWDSKDGCSRGHACGFSHGAPGGRYAPLLLDASDGHLIGCADGVACTTPECPYRHFPSKSRQVKDARFKAVFKCHDASRLQRFLSENNKKLKHQRKKPAASTGGGSSGGTQSGKNASGGGSSGGKQSTPTAPAAGGQSTSTTPCRDWDSKDGCSRGHACGFSHGAPGGRYALLLLRGKHLIKCAEGVTCSTKECPFRHFHARSLQLKSTRFKPVLKRHSEARLKRFVEENKTRRRQQGMDSSGDDDSGSGGDNSASAPADQNSSTKPSRAARACRDWASGGCKRGSQCSFDHTAAGRFHPDIADPHNPSQLRACGGGTACMGASCCILSHATNEGSPEPAEPTASGRGRRRHSAGASTGGSPQHSWSAAAAAKGGPGQNPWPTAASAAGGSPPPAATHPVPPATAAAAAASASNKQQPVRQRSASADSTASSTSSTTSRTSRQSATVKLFFHSNPGAATVHCSGFVRPAFMCTEYRNACYAKSALAAITGHPTLSALLSRATFSPAVDIATPLAQQPAWNSFDKRNDSALLATLIATVSAAERQAGRAVSIHAFMSVVTAYPSFKRDEPADCCLLFSRIFNAICESNPAGAKATLGIEMRCTSTTTREQMAIGLANSKMGNILETNSVTARNYSGTCKDAATTINRCIAVKRLVDSGSILSEETTKNLKGEIPFTPRDGVPLLLDSLYQELTDKLEECTYHAQSDAALSFSYVSSRTMRIHNGSLPEIAAISARRTRHSRGSGPRVQEKNCAIVLLPPEGLIPLDANYSEIPISDIVVDEEFAQVLLINTVIVHHGQLYTNGHYTTWVRRDTVSGVNAQWIGDDGTTMTTTELNNTLETGSCHLVHVLVSPAPPGICPSYHMEGGPASRDNSSGSASGPRSTSPSPPGTGNTTDAANNTTTATPPPSSSTPARETADAATDTSTNNTKSSSTQTASGSNADSCGGSPRRPPPPPPPPPPQVIVCDGATQAGEQQRHAEAQTSQARPATSATQTLSVKQFHFGCQVEDPNRETFVKQFTEFFNNRAVLATEHIALARQEASKFAEIVFANEHKLRINCEKQLKEEQEGAVLAKKTLADATKKLGAEQQRAKELATRVAELNTSLDDERKCSAHLRSRVDELLLGANSNNDFAEQLQASEQRLHAAQRETAASHQRAESLQRDLAAAQDAARDAEAALTAEADSLRQQVESITARSRKQLDEANEAAAQSRTALEKMQAQYRTESDAARAKHDDVSAKLRATNDRLSEEERASRTTRGELSSAQQQQQKLRIVYAGVGGGVLVLVAALMIAYRNRICRGGRGGEHQSSAHFEKFADAEDVQTMASVEEVRDRNAGDV